MRIWFDLSNSPHVSFFSPMIRELAKAHEIIITSRPLANTVDLLRMSGFDFKVVGRHYGANKIMKIMGYPVRILQLCAYLRRWRPDVGVSHSSFHSPVVCRILGIRSIYLNDNEHALGNIPSFLFANVVMVPEYLARQHVLRQGARGYKLIQYPGVKEGVYLWQNFHNRQRAAPSSGGSGRPTVYIRPEPWAAQYYSGRRNFMDGLIRELERHVNVVLLPRGKDQEAHYRGEQFLGVYIPEKPVELQEFARDCDLFIGAGGTMTREAAVLGIPTISVYQGDLLDVDRYLIRTGHLVHRPDLDAAYAMDYLAKRPRAAPDTALLSKGQEAYEMIKNVLLASSHRRS